MIEIVALELDLNGKENHRQYLRTIEFDMDGGKPFCYRGRVSYEAFADVTKKRYYNKRAGLTYRMKRKEEYQFDVQLWKRTMARHPDITDIYNVPNIKLNSLWEFYEYIGYDYKAKKYYPVSR